MASKRRSQMSTVELADAVVELATKYAGLLRNMPAGHKLRPEIERKVAKAHDALFWSWEFSLVQKQIADAVFSAATLLANGKHPGWTEDGVVRHTVKAIEQIVLDGASPQALKAKVDPDLVRTALRAHAPKPSPKGSRKKAAIGLARGRPKKGTPAKYPAMAALFNAIGFMTNDTAVKHFYRDHLPHQIAKNVARRKAR